MRDNAQAVSGRNPGPEEYVHAVEAGHGTTQFAAEPKLQHDDDSAANVGAHHLLHRSALGMTGCPALGQEPRIGDPAAAPSLLRGKQDSARGLVAQVHRVYARPPDDHSEQGALLKPVLLPIPV